MRILSLLKILATKKESSILPPILTSLKNNFYPNPDPLRELCQPYLNTDSSHSCTMNSQKIQVKNLRINRHIFKALVPLLHPTLCMEFWLRACQKRKARPRSLNGVSIYNVTSCRLSCLLWLYCESCRPQNPFEISWHTSANTMRHGFYLPHIANTSNHTWKKFDNFCLAYADVS